MKTCHETYNAIYVDIPRGTDDNLNKLYSVEFFSFIERSLADNGFAVLSAPGIEFFSDPDTTGVSQMLPENQWPVYYATLQAAHFNLIQPYMVNLEPNNEKAMIDLYQYLGGGNNYRKHKVSKKILFSDLQKRDAARGQLEKYVRGLRQGFILAKRERRSIFKRYEKLPITFHVLNEERYYGAFNLQFPFPESIDLDRVNSLVHPQTFNRENAWYIPKLPE